MISNFSKALPGALALGLLITTCNLPGIAGNGGFWKSHPRRAEVLQRDRNLNNKIQCEKGELGGHYGQLKAEDRAIRRQEQADSRMNGGHLSRSQQQQLNHEENRLNRQINRYQR